MSDSVSYTVDGVTFFYPLADLGDYDRSLLRERFTEILASERPKCVDPECDAPAVPGRLINLCQSHFDEYRAWVAAGRPSASALKGGDQ